MKERGGAGDTCEERVRVIVTSIVELAHRVLDQMVEGASVAASALLATSTAELLRREAEGMPALEYAPGDRLDRLVRSFCLDDTDLRLLMAGAAPELSPQCERLFAVLQDDLTRRRASIWIAMALAGLHPDDAVARARLEPGGALVQRDAVEILARDQPFPSREIKAPDRIVRYLLGDTTPDPLVAGPARMVATVEGEAGARLAAAIKGGARLCYLREAHGGDGPSLGASAYANLGIPVLVADATVSDDPVAMVRALRVEARLQGAAIVVGPLEALAKGGQLLRSLADDDWPVVLWGARTWDPGWCRSVPYVVTAPALPWETQTRLWSSLLDDPLPGEALAEAVVTLRLTADQIGRAATAASLAAAAEGRTVTAEDVRLGARRQNSGGLESLAQRVEPTATWDDLILAPPVVQLLKELVARARWRPLVYGDWGLKASGARGDGLRALFAGPSGTGKSLAAEVIAGDLGLDLYVVDLSSVVDKYIGETEKNLERIFVEAERVNGVLFFDEADALFGKRSEVHDSHDRYANLETAYLLQRLDEYSGIAMLATNLRSNIDDAFTRRLDTTVSFPMPEEPERRRLWSRFFRKVPIDETVDLDFCTRAFKISGGSIRNIVVSAAFLAAEKGPPVLMEDVVRAVQREYQKMGNMVIDAEFGEYADFLRMGQSA